MITFHTVIRGEILSGTDRPRRLATGQFLLAACHQQRLAAIYRELRLHPQYGPGESGVINDIQYYALFDAGWMLEVEAQVVFGARHATQLLDADSFWSDYQNAMAFPSVGLQVPKPANGGPLYTVVVNDRQFTSISVRTIADPMATREQDVLIARFTAHPPPSLRLALAH